jgi:membrane protease YdiL (CAAX protease family)
MADEEPPVRELSPLGAVALSFVCLAALLGVMLLGSAFTDGETVSIIFVGAAYVVAPMVALYVGLMRYAPHEPTGPAVGLIMPDGRDWMLALIAIGVGAAVVPIATELHLRLLEMFPPSPVSPEEAEPTGMTMGILLVCEIVAIPAANELLFRGFIQRRLQRTRGATQAWVLTLLLMSLMPLDPTTMPTTAVLAGPLGYLALRAESVWVVIAGRVAQVATPYVAALLGWKSLVEESTHMSAPVLAGSAAIAALGLVLASQARFARRLP